MAVSMFTLIGEKLSENKLTKPTNEN